MMNDERKDPRKPTALQIRFKSATIAEFVEKHAKDISRGGMFIKMKSPFPPGTLIKFDVRITEESMIHGVGRVVWCRAETKGDAPAGMGIKFIKIEEKSIPVLEAILAEKDSRSIADEPNQFEDPLPKPKIPVPSAPSLPQETSKRTMMGVPKPSFPKASHPSDESVSAPAVPERKGPKVPSIPPPTPDRKSLSKISTPEMSERKSLKPQAPSSSKAAPPAAVHKPVGPPNKPAAPSSAKPPSLTMPRPVPKAERASTDRPSLHPKSAAEPPKDEEKLLFNLSEGNEEPKDHIFLAGSKDEFVADVDSALDTALGSDSEEESETRFFANPSVEPKPSESKAPAADRSSPTAAKEPSLPPPPIITPLPRPAGASSKKKGDYTVAIIIAVILVGVAVTAGWFFLRGKEAPSEQKTTAEQIDKPTPPPPPKAVEPKDTGEGQPKESPKVTSIAVDSTPREAKVFLNGVEQEGSTPLTINDVEIGKDAEVKIQKFGFASYVQTTTPSEAPTSIAATLTPLQRKLEIVSEPPNVKVLIGDRDLGRTPLKTVKNDMDLNTELIFRKEGYWTVNRTIAEKDWVEKDGMLVLIVSATLDKKPEGGAGNSGPDLIIKAAGAGTQGQVTPPPPEVKTDTEATAPPENKTESQTQPAPEVKPEPKPEPEVKPEPKPEPEPEVKPEPEAKPKPTVELVPDPKPEEKPKESEKNIEENPF